MNFLGSRRSGANGARHVCDCLWSANRRPVTDSSRRNGRSTRETLLGRKARRPTKRESPKFEYDEIFADELGPTDLFFVSRRFTSKVRPRPTVHSCPGKTAGLRVSKLHIQVNRIKILFMPYIRTRHHSGRIVRN